jgi:hypothetical protein
MNKVEGCDTGKKMEDSERNPTVLRVIQRIILHLILGFLSKLSSPVLVPCQLQAATERSRQDVTS